MRNFQNDFSDFSEHCWLNSASEGPLPNISKLALDECVHWKSHPYLLDIPKFIAIPLKLKKSIGQLINVAPQDVILANSASYGLHILANGINWQKHDEILLMKNDFPSDILPWLSLQKKGVVVKQIASSHPIITPQEVLAHLTSKTRLVCLSQAHTFSGHLLDTQAISQLCQKHNIIFVLNLSQTVGNRPIDVQALQPDAVVSAGYKWLCGPYGTGFCWMKPQLREQLDVNHNYWTVSMSEEELKKSDEIVYKEIKTARKFDVFGTANFFNFVPLTASIDYLLDVGLDQIYDHNQALIDGLINGLDQNQYKLISPLEKSKRSNLVYISHIDSDCNKDIFNKLTANNIHTAFWKGNIRLSPHLFNCVGDLNRALEVLGKRM